MSRIWHLGNDVVDLTSPRTRGKVHHRVFLRRVFNEEEREAIQASPVPELTLWALWAAKEAVFKSATKALGTPPIFHHPRYRISLSPRDLVALSEAPVSPSRTVGFAGRGRYQDLSFSLRLHRCCDFIHALAWIADPGGGEPPAGPQGGEPPALWGVVREEEADGASLKALRSRFSPEENRCIHQARSALSRLAARKALAGSLEVDEAGLEIRCGPGEPGRRIPLAYLDGRAISVDLTLSHDGPFMAWGFLDPQCPQGR